MVPRYRAVLHALDAVPHRLRNVVDCCQVCYARCPPGAVSTKEHQMSRVHSHPKPTPRPIPHVPVRRASRRGSNTPAPLDQAAAAQAA